jgi:stage II sporulation protein D
MRARSATHAALTALALLVLVGCLAALIAFTWRLRRPLPSVPPLPPAPPGVPRPQSVRVLLSQSRTEHTVSCPEGGTWRAVGEAGARPAAAGRGPWLLTASRGRLALDGEEQAERELQLQPNELLFGTGERSYRGTLVARVSDQGRLTLINVIEPEQYVRSVVGSEMYRHWPLEALMAQAVAARTFMLYAVSAKGYLTRADMAYRGVDAESAATDLATELTRGIILTYRDRALPAYFQNTCGGRTAAADKVFAEDPIPPLSGVPCDWCRSSPYYEWQAELPAALIAELLKDPRVKDVRSISPEGAEPDGYARFVLVNDEVRMAAGALQLSLGPDRIRSTCFTVTAEAGSFRFAGHGYGHGVGLCQWGARGMANDGKSWQEILLHYYPGALLQKAY